MFPQRPREPDIAHTRQDTSRGPAPPDTQSQSSPAENPTLEVVSTLNEWKRSRSATDNEGSLPNERHIGYGKVFGDHRSGEVSARNNSPVRIKLPREEYTIGWVCALHIEMAAAHAMLDEIHECLPNALSDSNTYTLGCIGNHNVVIACLPAGDYGTRNAATVGSNMNRSFPSIRVRLMVGVGGGAPGKADLRLGDVVVGTRTEPYDLGKTVQGGHFQPTGIPYRPPPSLMTAVAKLRADHELNPTKIPAIISKMLAHHPLMARYAHPGQFQDWLFKSTYDHGDTATTNCEFCDKTKLVRRLNRPTTDPKIHYGGIASANQVMKHGETRDRLARGLDVICFEMEAAGLMDNFPCLIIRGICDYSDSHKNKQWQEYAAAAAAAYAKELLSVVSTSTSQKLPSNETLSAKGKFVNFYAGVRVDIFLELLMIRRNDMLGSLSFAQIDSRHSSIENACSETCEWLIKTPEYSEWRDPDKLSQHRGFLWINGKPGAGKSTLMKFACTRTFTTTKQVKIAFFFNARGDDLEKSSVGMYRSLLHQLLLELPDLQELLDNIDLASENESGNNAWNIKTLRQLFFTAVLRLGNRQLTCFIDALDECDENEVRDMINDFEELGQRAIDTGMKLSICFSSRHYPFIHVKFGRKLTLESQIGHEDDLKRYVREKLKVGKTRSNDDLRVRILQKAGGIFMWVVLVVSILNKEFDRGRIFAVERRLEELPPKLSELFRDILTRDKENMADLLLCIQWVLYAKRPLKPDEFYFAVASGLDPDPGSLAESIHQDDISRFVLSSSKGLAEITGFGFRDQVVQFIHESVRDYLVKDGGMRQLWPELGDKFESLSHDRLKKCCQTYLKVDISDCIPPNEILPKANSRKAMHLRGLVSRRFPFLSYAVDCVLYHSNKAASEVSQDEFLSEFPLKMWIKIQNIFEQFQIRRHDDPVSILYILAEKNLPNLIRSLRQHDSRICIFGGRYRYPLFAALKLGHREAVKALLQQETSSPQIENTLSRLEYGSDFEPPRSGEPLFWAFEVDCLDIAMAWIKRGEVDMNQKDDVGNTALSLAAQRGAETMVRFLLEAGTANINSKGLYGRTPLLWAAKNGHESIVRLLLETGKVDIDSKDNRGHTPLVWATENGHEATVRLLLETEEADINSKDNIGQAALSRVAVNGHTSIVKLLLATGNVDINSKDYWGETPLSLAASKGHEAVVRLLLATGNVDINSTNYWGETPLSLAASKRHDAVVNLLANFKVAFERRLEEISKRTPPSYTTVSEDTTET